MQTFCANFTLKDHIMIYIANDTDTVFSVASKCGISVSRLIEENVLRHPYDLVCGQALYAARPERIYRVRGGDTVSGICERFSMKERALLRANPYLAKDGFPYPGQSLVPYEGEGRFGALSVFGYMQEQAKESDTRPSLPYLTALAVLGGSIRDGTLRLPALPLYARGKVPLLLAAVTLREQDIHQLLSDSLVSSLKKEGFDGVLLCLDCPKGQDTVTKLRAFHTLLEKENRAVFVLCSDTYMQNEPLWGRECAAATDGLLLTQTDGAMGLGRRMEALRPALTAVTQSRIFCELNTFYTEEVTVSSASSFVKKGDLSLALRQAQTKKRPMQRKEDMGCVYYEFPFCKRGQMGTKRFTFEDAGTLYAAFGRLAKSGGVLCRACTSAVPFLYMLSRYFAINE